jgi:hypothetical protein
MKKFETFLLFAFFISLVTFGLSFLCFIGAEPNTITEESLYEYQHFYDKGNLGWYLGWTSLFSFVVLIATYFGLKKIQKLNQSKPQTF